MKKNTYSLALKRLKQETGTHLNLCIFILKHFEGDEEKALEILNSYEPNDPDTIIDTKKLEKLIQKTGLDLNVCLQALDKYDNDFYGAFEELKEHMPNVVKFSNLDIPQAVDALKQNISSLGIDVETMWNPPATDAEISELQEIILNVNPQLLTLLKVHNGQIFRSINAIVDSRGLDWTLCSTEEIIEHWKNEKALLDSGDYEDYEPDADIRVQPVWWDTGWVPFAHENGCNYLCIDTNPTEKGKKGQIIYYHHEDSQRYVEASSLLDLFVSMLKSFEKGTIAIHEKYNYLTLKK
jgi:cell wall assembly regulator SMI1